MDNFSTNEPFNNNPVPEKKGLATASLLCSVAALFGLMMVYPGIILGIVAVTLGILAKVNYGKFHTSSILGIVLGIVAIGIGILLFITVLSLMQNPDFIEFYNEFMNQYYAQ